MIVMQTQLRGRKIKLNVKVYSLASCTKCYSPNFTQLPPGHRTCSFLKPSQLLAEHTAWLPFLALRNYSNTQAFLVLPGTHLLLVWESAHLGKVPCPGTQCCSAIKPIWPLEPAISHLQVAHATTEPWCPMAWSGKNTKNTKPKVVKRWCRKDLVKYINFIVFFKQGLEI